jgi:hypothetical protein
MARRLNSSQDVRRYLASLAHRLEAGEIEPRVSDSLTRIMNAILIALRNETAERELEVLEQLEQDLKGGR